MIKLKSYNSIKEHNNAEFETFGERLKFLISNSGLNPTTIQKKYGIPEATIRSWLKSKKTIKIDNVDKIVNVFKDSGIEFDINWLINGKRSNEIFTVQNSKNTSNDTSADDSILMLDESQKYKSLYDDAITFRVPIAFSNFIEGDMIGGRKILNDIWKHAVGRVCISERIDLPGLFISIPYINEEDNLLYFLDVQFNKLYSQNVIKFCAPIVWHRSQDIER